MNFLIILAAKISEFILGLLGRGSVFPGTFAYKFNKNILTYFERPKKVICVTGTTGKTSIAGTLAHIYEDAGFRVVSNTKGSNLITGVIAAFIKASGVSGKTKVDVLVLEIDERYVKKVFAYITPDYFLINNLSRDQLARNGHAYLVFEDINNCIDAKTHLLLNGDDPLIRKFALNKENIITYYGLAKSKYSTKKSLMNTIDQAYCPICHEKLEYSYFNYGSLGAYTCPNHDYDRLKPDYEAKIVKDGFMIEKNKVFTEVSPIYNIYNLTACYALARADNIPAESIVKTLNNMPKRRITKFNLRGVDATILLSKNETPISYNQSLEYIKARDDNKTIAIGFTKVSGRYDLKDLSWLYDINFELLKDDSVKKIILIGPFAYDLAARLKMAGINPKKFDYALDYQNSLDYCIDKAIGNLYFVVYFDLDYAYLDILKERNLL